MARFRIAFTLLALSLGCAHQGGSRELGDPAAEAIASDSDVVVVGFRDSSVPPPYHQSHTITITRTEIRRVVHGYNDIHDDRRAAIEPRELDKVLGALRGYGMRAAERSEDGGCTGGTSHLVRVEQGDAIVLDGYIYHCAGIDAGTLEGAIVPFVAEVEHIADTHLGKYRESKLAMRRRMRRSEEAR
jgi:hypothetical protein